MRRCLSGLISGVLLCAAVQVSADPFRRGDANEDSRVDISDMVFVLDHLFLGGPRSGCEDIMDVDDSGLLNIVDPIFGLNFLFLGGPPIPDPGPFDPGLDPTEDEWGCGDLIEKACLGGLVAQESTLPGVSIEFTDSPCEMTLAEARAGVTFRYAVVVDEMVSGIAEEQGTCQAPGTAMLYAQAVISGGDQRYCLCDLGKCFVRPHPFDIEAGVYDDEFDWDGVNWFGPSDFFNPKGPPFPPGIYTFSVRARGRVTNADGREVPYEVGASHEFELLP